MGDNVLNMYNYIQYVGINHFVLHLIRCHHLLNLWFLHTCSVTWQIGVLERESQIQICVSRYRYKRLSETRDSLGNVSKPTHNILSQKLNHYGIRGKANEWLSSYLNNRKQYVFYNGTSSSLSNISCGVPQGSILGPILFFLYKWHSKCFWCIAICTIRRRY